MKNLLSFFTIILLLAIAFTSCKKNSPRTNSDNSDTLAVNTIIATINDTVYTFNQNITDTSGTAGSTSSIELKASDSIHSIVLGVISIGNPIIDTSYNNSKAGSLIIADFGTTSNPTQYYYVNTVPSSFSITFTSLSPSSLKGTFQGTFYLNGDTTNTTTEKTVTN